MKRKNLLRWLGVFALLCIAALIAGILRAGYFLEATAHAPVKADLMVALGGDDGGRVNSTVELYRKGFAPLVLLTGEGVHSKTRKQFMSYRARYLLDEGIPQAALLFDYRSNSSWDEAVNTLQLMREMKLDRALVVSDPPHMRRLSWVWDKVFAGSGKTYTLVASEMDELNPEFWWRTSPNAQFVFGEYIKLAYYLIQY